MSAAYKKQAEVEANLELDDAVAGSFVHVSFLHVYGRSPSLVCLPVSSNCYPAGKAMAGGWTLTPRTPEMTHTPTDDQGTRLCKMDACADGCVRAYA